MGLSQSLWTGLTGLKSHQTWTNIVGNNLTNVSTDGFKRSDVSFSDILYSAINPGSPARDTSGSVNPSQSGTGVMVAGVLNVFTQAPLEYSGRVFDVGIEGQGFFTASDLNNTQNYYTRNGRFYLGLAEGTANTQPLLTSEGFYVQGYNATNGVIGPNLGNLMLPELGQLMPGQASTEVEIKGNVNSGAELVGSNSVQTSQSGSVGTWLSNTGSAINIGGVQTTPPLSDTTGSAVSGSTDLLNLAFLRGNQNQGLFDAVPAGYEVNYRDIEVNFTKGGLSYTQTFRYGVDGTTLQDFSTWLTGGLGDAGTPATQRIDGGALGTVRTREYTVNGDGFAAPAEQAGGYLRYDSSGNSIYSVASNLGNINALGDIRISTITNMTSPAGETRNAQAYYRDFLVDDPYYPSSSKGGNVATGYEVFTPDASIEEGVTEEGRSLKFVKLSQDSNGTVWRWYADGQSIAGDGLNQGTGIIRFDNKLVYGTSQVLFSNTEGGTTLTMDFSQLTQAGGVNSPTGVPDGFPSGELELYAIDTGGIITGRYTNGQVATLAQIATAVFPNENGLLSMGGTLFQASEISGDPLFSPAGQMNPLAVLRSGFMESSNVEMAQEMSKLLLSQRGYQISSRVITTSDDMLKEIAQLKR